jgi:hypothetical protein
MLSGKKAPVMISTARGRKAQLEALYTRLSAIDQLIESLEAYDRYRSTRATQGPQRRTA